MPNLRPILLEPPETFDASGAFETCRVKAGKVLFLQEHLHRLGHSLNTVGITAWDRKKVSTALSRTARQVGDGTVRVALRRTGSFLIHSHRGSLYPEAMKRKGIVVVTVATRWPTGEPGIAQAKGSERLSSILARAEGGEATEVLRFGPQGYLTEGTVSNLFIVKNRIVLTPPPWLGVLEGVTRSRILRAARRLGMPVEESPFTRHDLFNAEEAFLTNVLMSILPIRAVDGRKIGKIVPGPFTRRFMRSLR